MAIVLAAHLTLHQRRPMVRGCLVVTKLVSKEKCGKKLLQVKLSELGHDVDLDVGELTGSPHNPQYVSHMLCWI